MACALAETGIAGYPNEYFTPPVEASCRRRWSVDPGDLNGYLCAVITDGTTPNGVFGVKLHWPDFAGLVARAREKLLTSPGDTEIMSVLFPNPRYVLLTRRDRLAQAVSFWRAQASGVWWQTEGTPLSERDRHWPPLFDEIENLHAAFVDQENKWRAFFDEGAIRPHEIVYEDFVQDYVGTVRRLLDHAGIEYPVGFDVGLPKLQLQSDSFTRQFLEEYRSRILPSTPSD